MQPLSTTIATTTLSIDAPGYSHNRNRDHGPAPTRPNVIQPISKPVQFSFTKDGTVARLETYHMEPYPGYRASATSSSPSSSPSPSFPSSPICKASGIVNKDWKNVAISEQDDAEFAAMEARAEIRAQAEAKRKLVGLGVYMAAQAPACGVCGVRGLGGASAQGAVEGRHGHGHGYTGACGTSVVVWELGGIGIGIGGVPDGAGEERCRA
ncbi:hypothetical protein J3R82DRAFT_6906 [Butyriboletus roseoflavus]|nr:hypothetical protein J3R82DRAFT_6906 [Butyriboletus roseoflavus]